LRLLTHRHLPLLLAAIAVTLLLPSLGVGFQLDDHFLRLALADPPIDPHWSRTPVDLFAFFKDESLVRYARETGAAPWWTPNDFRLAFSRPLSGVTHWLDFRCWGDRPSLMHAHSLAWFGACIVVATVLVMAAFYGLVASHWTDPSTMEPAIAYGIAWIVIGLTVLLRGVPTPVADDASVGSGG